MNWIDINAIETTWCASDASDCVNCARALLPLASPELELISIQSHIESGTDIENWARTGPLVIVWNRPLKWLFRLQLRNRQFDPVRDAFAVDDVIHITGLSVGRYYVKNTEQTVNRIWKPTKTCRLNKCKHMHIMCKTKTMNVIKLKSLEQLTMLCVQSDVESTAHLMWKQLIDQKHFHQNH